MVKTKLHQHLAEEPQNIAIGLDISARSTGVQILQWNDEGTFTGYAFGVVNLGEESSTLIEELKETDVFKLILSVLYESNKGAKHISLKAERFQQMGNSRGNGATEKISVARYVFRMAFKKFLGDSWDMWAEDNNIPTATLNKTLKLYHNSMISEGELLFEQILPLKGATKSKYPRIVATNKLIKGFIDLKGFTMKEKEDIADATGISLTEYGKWAEANNIKHW